MSKTHIAVGVASALVIAHTGSVESCVAAMIGGSVGGIIADCDITPSRAHKDALIGRIIVIAVSVVSLAIDYWYGAGVCDYLVGSLGVWLIVGIVLFAALTFVGGHTDHRSFTHSLVGMAAFCGSFYLICEPLLPPTNRASSCFGHSKPMRAWVFAVQKALQTRLCWCSASLLQRCCSLIALRRFSAFRSVCSNGGESQSHVDELVDEFAIDPLSNPWFGGQANGIFDGHPAYAAVLVRLDAGMFAGIGNR